MYEERLWRHHQLVPLRPKTWALLRYLAERPQVLIPKDQVLNAVWGSIAVSDDALTRTVSELRRTLADDARTPRFIQTVHRRGFRFIAATEAIATDHPLLAGRDRELAALRRAFHNASTGERQIVLVSGGPGSGKTTLVRAFLQSLQEGDYPTAVPSLDYSDNMAKLARTFQDISEARAGDVAAGSPVEPQLIVLEDLHTSDAETITLLSALGRRPDPARLMVIATYRPADAIAFGHPIVPAAGLLQERACCTRITLERLSRVAVADYLERRLGRAPVAEYLVTLVHRQTFGHPLFVVALVDHLLTSGRLTEPPLSPARTTTRRSRLRPRDAQLPALQEQHGTFNHRS
jgi:DNA-binding winged helix-turn-helix (wHTH) protein